MAPSATKHNLQVMITSEAEDRVVFGLNMALAAAVSDVGVVVFFALSSARWVCAKHDSPDQVAELLNELLSHRVEVLCCSACIHAHCEPEGDDVQLVEGVRQAGLTTIALRAAGACPTITI